MGALHNNTRKDALGLMQAAKHDCATHLDTIAKVQSPGMAMLVVGGYLDAMLEFAMKAAPDKAQAYFEDAIKAKFKQPAPGQTVTGPGGIAVGAKGPSEPEAE